MLNGWVTEMNETALPVENLDEPREIRQRPGQSVDLVDHDRCRSAPGLDVGEQALQRRARQRGPGDPAIVVNAVGQRDPAFRLLLAGDVGRAGGALGIQRIEGLLEAFVGGFAGVDGAAHRGQTPRPW